MERPVFVARERELARLDGFLDRVLAGQGQTCFVTGEAGSGKTALVTEFARRVQDRHSDLVVAIGQSDAHTGFGDPFLPFREVLGQLTGDVEAKLAQGSITEENAGRLRKLLGLSGQALVAVGPDLVGIFVPGAGLATRVGAFVAEKVGWLDKLEELTKRPREGEALGSTGIEQAHILEQYTNVLKKLAAEQPLLLVLDDLQWADAASIALLFRLGRRIGESRILLVGTYRPEEVALGRDGERHPLEKVLAEFKRYFGDIWVDLDRAREAERQRFVDAFVDTEPNRLGEGFRQALYDHTDGHPLFTIELLRDMQERGDLVQDEGGRWLEGLVLDWRDLPDRVEGVIEERIGRLEEELREALTVGSVEGEDFTAEVVARVRESDARGLIDRLSGEVERQHRLVRARGIQRLDPGGQRLSLYRFQHNLFQTYLYNDLDEVQRVVLHEDVGNVLEALYGERANEIAVQLARHFVEAGIAKKAVYYLRRAGEQAAARFANEEAVAYLSRTLGLTPETAYAERYSLLLARDKVYSLQGKREAQHEDLAALEELARVLDDGRKLAEVTLRQARLAITTSDYPAAAAAAQVAIDLAQAAQDTRSEATGYLVWGLALFDQGDWEASPPLFERALDLYREFGDRQGQARALGYLGFVPDEQGDYAAAMEYYEQSLRIFREIGDRQGEKRTLNNLGVTYARQSDPDQARIHYEQVLRLAREMGDRRGEGIVLGNLGSVSAEQGDYDRARTCFEQSRFISCDVGDRQSEGRALSNLGAVSADQGDYAGAVTCFEQALCIYREIGDPRGESILLNDLGHALVSQGAYAAATTHFEQSLNISQEIGHRLAEADSLGSLGVVSDHLGDYSRVKAHYEQSLRITCEIGDRRGESNWLAYLGLLSHHLGDDEAAREHSQQALQIAQEIGDRNAHGRSLTTLGHALEGLELLAEAADAYRQALTLRRELGQPHMAMEPLAGLARVHLAQGDVSQARNQVEEISAYLETSTLDGTEEPFRVYWTCYQALKADQDPRSRAILEAAHRLLQERAAKISDGELRRSFLENVAAHREIVREFRKSASSAGEQDGLRADGPHG